jgi:hypothetical protein
MAWAYYARRCAGFFPVYQRRARVCQCLLKEGEKSLAQKARPEGLRFWRQRFPAVLAAFWRLLATMLRLFAVSLRLFAIMLRLFAVVLRLLTVVLAVFRRQFTLMLRAFFWRRRRVVGSESP